MTEQPNDLDADDPGTEPDHRKPAKDEATPEQPVIQRAGTPLVGGTGDDRAAGNGDVAAPDTP
jgi:hypothetical protein